MRKSSWGLGLILGATCAICVAGRAVAQEADAAAEAAKAAQTPANTGDSTRDGAEAAAANAAQPTTGANQPTAGSNQSKDAAAAASKMTTDASKSGDPSSANSAFVGKLSPEESDAFLIQRFDKNRNGQIDGPEKAAAAAAGQISSSRASGNTVPTPPANPRGFGGNPGLSNSNVNPDANIGFYNGYLTGPGQERGDPKLAPQSDAPTVRRRRGTPRIRKERSFNEFRPERQKKGFPEGGRILNKEDERDQADLEEQGAKEVPPPFRTGKDSVFGRDGAKGGGESSPATKGETSRRAGPPKTAPPAKK
jgi:hypothetical protein